MTVGAKSCDWDDAAPMSDAAALAGLALLTGHGAVGAGAARFARILMYEEGSALMRVKVIAGRHSDPVNDQSA